MLASAVLLWLLQMTVALTMLSSMGTVHGPCLENADCGRGLFCNREHASSVNHGIQSATEFPTYVHPPRAPYPPAPPGISYHLPSFFTPPAAPPLEPPPPPSPPLPVSPPMDPPTWYWRFGSYRASASENVDYERASRWWNGTALGTCEMCVFPPYPYLGLGDASLPDPQCYLDDGYLVLYENVPYLNVIGMKPSTWLTLMLCALVVASAIATESADADRTLLYIYSSKRVRSGGQPAVQDDHLQRTQTADAPEIDHADADSERSPAVLPTTSGIKGGAEQPTVASGVVLTINSPPPSPPSLQFAKSGKLPSQTSFWGARRRTAATPCAVWRAVLGEFLIFVGFFGIWTALVMGNVVRDDIDGSATVLLYGSLATIASMLGAMCRMADDLWRVALLLLHSARRFGMMPSALSVVPIFILMDKADGVSIALNALAALFIVEVDDVLSDALLSKAVRLKIQEASTLDAHPAAERRLMCTRHIYFMMAFLLCMLMPLTVYLVPPDSMVNITWTFGAWTVSRTFGLLEWMNRACVFAVCITQTMLPTGDCWTKYHGVALGNGFGMASAKLLQMGMNAAHAW